MVGSPRGGRSTSGSLGAYLLGLLKDKGWDTEVVHIQMVIHSLAGARMLVRAVEDADLVMLSFPTYFDSVPAEVVRTMNLLVQHGVVDTERTSFMAIANCGFIEAKQNLTALETCRLFARDAGLKWKGGLALGGGPMIDGRPLGEVGNLARNARRALEQAAEALNNGNAVPDEAIDLMARQSLPRALYIAFSNRGWKKQARLHGVGRSIEDQPFRR